MLNLWMWILLVASLTFSVAEQLDNSNENTHFQIFPKYDSFVDDCFILQDTFSTNGRNEDKNDHVCSDFYSLTCNKTKPTILSDDNFETKLNDQYSNFVKNMLDILNSDENNSVFRSKTLRTERQIYQNCMEIDKEPDIFSSDRNYQDTNNNYVTREDDKNYDSSNFIDNSLDNNNLGNKLESKYSILYITDFMLKKLGYNVKIDKWQLLDNNLTSLGFGHTFFYISVVKDTKNHKKNIIFLQPPLIKDWNSNNLIDFLSDIYVYLQIKNFQLCQDQGSSPEDEQENKLSTKSDDAFIESEEKTNESTSNKDIKSNDDDLYTNNLCKRFKGLTKDDLMKKIINDGDNEVLSFLQQLGKAILGFSNGSEKSSKDERFTIGSWNEVYNNDTTDRTTISRVNWQSVLETEFQHVGIVIDENEPIIVRNVEYFKKLQRYLENYDKSTVVYSILSLFVAKNLRYVAWDAAQEIRSADKTSFCFDQTKLYGLSNHILHLTQKKLTDDLEVPRAIATTIFASFSRKIRGNSDLSVAKKSKIQIELNDITKNVFKNLNKKDKNTLNHYYGNYKLTADFLKDIINYQAMIRMKNLLQLRKSSCYVIPPFSINEIETSRNRYVLHTLLSAIVHKSIFSVDQREALYATFGVRTAAFLYSLLNENPAERDLLDRHNSDWLQPFFSFPEKVVKCFVPDNLVSYQSNLAYKTIIDTYSLRIALDAMLHKTSSHSIKYFFKTFTWTECNSNVKKVTNRVLSNLKEFQETYDCSNEINENSKCKENIYFY